MIITNSEEIGYEEDIYNFYNTSLYVVKPEIEYCTCISYSTMYCEELSAEFDFSISEDRKTITGDTSTVIFITETSSIDSFDKHSNTFTKTYTEIPDDLYSDYLKIHTDEGNFFLISPTHRSTSGLEYTYYIPKDLDLYNRVETTSAYICKGFSLYAGMIDSSYENNFSPLGGMVYELKSPLPDNLSLYKYGNILHYNRIFVNPIGIPISDSETYFLHSGNNNTGRQASNVVSWSSNQITDTALYQNQVPIRIEEGNFVVLPYVFNRSSYDPQYHTDVKDPIDDTLVYMFGNNTKNTFIVGTETDYMSYVSFVFYKIRKNPYGTLEKEALEYCSVESTIKSFSATPVSEFAQKNSKYKTLDQSLVDRYYDISLEFQDSEQLNNMNSYDRKLPLRIVYKK